MFPLLINLCVNYRYRKSSTVVFFCFDYINAGTFTSSICQLSTVGGTITDRGAQWIAQNINPPILTRSPGLRDHYQAKQTVTMHPTLPHGFGKLLKSASACKPPIIISRHQHVIELTNLR